MPDNSQSQYEWRETSPGRFERDLDEVEQFYASMAKLYEGTGRSFFAITGYLEISLELSPSEKVRDVERRVNCAFQSAWSRLRIDHPTIASYFIYDWSRKRCKKVCETSKSEAHSDLKWLESSFTIIDNGQSGLDFANSDPPVKQHATLYLITPPANAKASSSGVLRRDVVFRSPHVTIDGIGTLMLLDSLMAHAAESFVAPEACPVVNIKQEHLNLSPSFRIAAAIPSKANLAQLHRFTETHAAESRLREDVELLGIPFKRDAMLPLASRRTATHLSKAEAHMITERCRAQGLSVTHAFHAGIVLAAYKMAERHDMERKMRYVSYCLVNLRNQCIPPYNSARHAASVYHAVPGNSLVIDFTVPVKESSRNPREIHNFTSVATQIKDYYLGVKYDPDFVPMTPLFFRAFTPSYPEEPCCEVPLPNQSPSASMSSMGVIERIIQPSRSPFTIDAPWVTGDEYGTGVGVFLGSWRGEMSLSAVFNMAFHEEGKIAKFLSDAKRIVSVGLDIK